MLILPLRVSAACSPVPGIGVAVCRNSRCYFCSRLNDNPVVNSSVA